MMSRIKFLSVLVGLVVVSLPGQSYAFESHKISDPVKKYSVFLEGGTAEGDAEADRLGGSLRFNFGKPLVQTENWEGVTYLEFSISYWDGENGRTSTDSLVDFGLTPVFRFQKKVSRFVPFAEIGLGAHFHTEDGIGDENFDIPFAFGSHFGLGFRFGPDSKYELTYRFQHLSNASLGDDNPGINFHAVLLGFHF